MTSAATNRDGDRHGWNDTVCGRWHRIIRGRAAARLLDNGQLPRWGAAVDLPSWLWRRPAINVGRKARPGAGGGKLRLPIRMQWEGGPIAVAATNTWQQLVWTAVGMGHTLAGTVTLDVAASLDTVALVDDEQIVATATRPSVAHKTMTAKLRSWVRDGELARWEALMGLEPMAWMALKNAATAATAEITNHQRDLGKTAHTGQLLSDTSLEAVANRLLLGDPDTDKPSAMVRLLDRCLNPHTFVKADPLRYVSLSIRRDADAAVRKALDDPRAGRKIRTVIREQNPATPDDLLRAYKEQFPSDHVGQLSAAKAAAPATDPNATNLRITTVEDPDEDDRQPRRIKLASPRPDPTVRVIDDVTDKQTCASDIVDHAADTIGIDLPAGLRRRIIDQLARTIRPHLPYSELEQATRYVTDRIAIAVDLVDEAAANAGVDLPDRLRRTIASELAARDVERMPMSAVDELLNQITVQIRQHLTADVPVPA